MKRINSLIFVFLSAIIVLASCKTNYNVVRVDLNKKPSSRSGFYYMLPKNYLKVNITLDKQDNIKGPYSEYAKQYFGLTNVINQNVTTYSIKNISVETIAETDTANIYFVESNDAALKINFGQTAMLSDINCKEIVDISNTKVVSDLKISSNDEIDYPVLFRKFGDLNLYEKVDTIYKRVKLDTSYIIEKTFKTSLVEKTIDLKVKETVDYITKLKEAQYTVITGDLDATDKKNIEFMYRELQNQEEQYMKLFTGIIINNQLTYSYIYFPETDTNTLVTKAELCKFSPLKGITTNDGPDVDVVSIQINNSKYASNLEKYNTGKNKLQKGKHGFYYRIPAIVDVAILQNNIPVYTCKKDIAQMGMVLSLPLKNISFKFDETTGSIKLLKLN